MRDTSGKVLKEFNVKFAPINISTESNSIMLVLNDISEKSRLKEIKISEKLKTILMCSISHELRSPVNQINGVLSLLEPTLASKEQRDLMKIANSSTQSLCIKINDMLDYCEIETKTFKPEMVKFDVRKQMLTLESLFLPMIDQNNIKLYFFVQDTTPKVVFHDSKRITQILVNLLSNAIKYTKKGAILIKVDWLGNKNCPEGYVGRVRYTVSDSGCGIHRHHRENLFKLLDPGMFKAQPFDRYSLRNQRDIKISESIREGALNTTKLAGTGLGISQKIAKALGTKIELSSTVGVGSKFWFELDIPSLKSAECEDIQTQFSQEIRKPRMKPEIEIANNTMTANQVKFVQEAMVDSKKCVSVEVRLDNDSKNLRRIHDPTETPLTPSIS